MDGFRGWTWEAPSPTLPTLGAPTAPSHHAQADEKLSYLVRKSYPIYYLEVIGRGKKSWPGRSAADKRDKY
jgi:hypothetical protein